MHYIFLLLLFGYCFCICFCICFCWWCDCYLLPFWKIIISEYEWKKKRKVSEIQTDRSVEFIICVQLKRIGFRAGSISRYEQQVIWLEFVISESMNKRFLHDIYIWPHKLAECALARIQCVWSDLNCFMKRDKKKLFPTMKSVI